MPVRRWDVVHLDLQVDLDPEARTILGRTTHTIRPLLPHDHFRLHQEGLHIQRVEVDGVEVEARIGSGLIDIPVAPGVEHQVTVVYDAQPQSGLYFRSKKLGNVVTEVWTQGEDEENRYWFPSWDYPNDLFTVNTQVTAPEALVVRANGVLKGEVTAQKRTTWTFELQQPIVNYLIALAAGEYQVLEDTASGVQLEILGSRTEDPAVLKHGAGLVNAMLPFYEQLLGTPYPYPVYRQVYVQGFLYGGMENATLTLMTDERLVDPGAPERVTRLESVVSHELAHHWFGDLLTCYGWRELWLNEGFATFYEQRWAEHAHGADRAAASRFRTREGALKVEGPMAARAHTKRGEPNAGVYVRGSSVLHALRVYLGDDVFDGVIRSWVAQHQHQLVESEALRRQFEDATGEHLGWLFDQWVTGAGNPSWKVAWAHEAGKLTVTIAADEGPVFHTPVDVEIGTDPVRTERIWVDGTETRIVLDVEQAPRWIAVDPRGGVLGTFETQQSDAAWTAQLESSPSPLAQLDAVVALKDRSHEPATVALGALLNGDRDPQFRKRAAEPLGTHPTALAAAALIQALSDADGHVREAALKGLAAHEEHPDVVPAVRQRLDDPDPAVRGEALSTLSRLLGPKSLQPMRERLKTDDRSRTGEEHQAALDVLGERGTLEDARAALRFLSTRYKRGVRMSAMMMVRNVLLDAEASPKRTALQRDFIDEVRPALRDVDYRVRQYAVQAYRAAHADDLDDLRSLRATTTIDRERERIAEVLTSHRDPGEPEDPLERRVRALEEDKRATEERLEALEIWRL